MSELYFFCIVYLYHSVHKFHNGTLRNNKHKGSLRCMLTQSRLQAGPLL